MPRGILSGPFPAGCPDPPRRGSVPYNHSGARRPMRTPAAAIFVLCLVFGPTASPAYAQYGAKKLADRATGETYHVEVAGDFWFPSPDIAITSESLPGILGSR